MIRILQRKAAIIDIGSNTTRLVIFESAGNGKGFKEVENIKSSTRLRSYLNDQNIVSEQGISLLINTLQQFQTIIQHSEIVEVYVVATATIRQAQNGSDIIQRVKKEIGLEISLLSDYEEAYYGYLGVIHSLDVEEGITVDMGGGSTEITYFKDRKLVEFISLPFGSLSLKHLFVKGDIPTEEEMAEIRQYVNNQFRALPWLIDKHTPIFAMGGSARNMAQIHQEFIHYPLVGLDQYEMTNLDIEMVKNQVAPLSYAELQQLDGLSKDRVDTIIPAIEVLHMLSEYTKAPTFILSRFGLREGLLYGKWDLLETSYSARMDENIRAIAQEYAVDLEKGNKRARIATMLIQRINELFQDEYKLEAEDFTFLRRNASIYLFGKNRKEEAAPFTFYLLANRPIIGLSHKERVKYALVASYKSKGTFRDYIDPFRNWYTKDDRKKLCLLGAILIMSQCLIRTDRDIVENISISINANILEMNIKCNSFYALEQYHLEREKKHLEKILKMRVQLVFTSK